MRLRRSQTVQGSMFKVQVLNGAAKWPPAGVDDFSVEKLASPTALPVSRGCLKRRRFELYWLLRIVRNVRGNNEFYYSAKRENIPMPMIDADTHVDESEATWKNLEGTPHAKYIPVTIAMPPDEAKRAGYNPTNSRCWVVEGRLQNRAIRDEVNHPPRVLRELEDVPGRLVHMDKMGVAVQVIFPTFFNRYNTSNAEAEWALTTTYNRWIAEKCAPTKARLRWAAVLPLLRQYKAVE